MISWGKGKTPLDLWLPFCNGPRDLLSLFLFGSITPGMTRYVLLFVFP